jgi:hypothetical protein
MPPGASVAHNLPTSRGTIDRRRPVLRRVVTRFAAGLLLAPILGCLSPGAAPSCGSGGPQVRTPAGALWPNEPAGLPLLSDEPFNTLTENGWRTVQRQRTNGSGVVVARDSTAPVSPPGVLQFAYAVGFPGGYSPAAVFYDPATATRDTYFAFWWKPSAPWQNNSPSSVNKIAFLLTASGATIYIMMFGDNGAYTVQVEPEFPDDVRRLAPNAAATPVVLGAWHRIEWHVRYNTTPALRNGLAEWWLDGVLQGRYTDLQMPGDAGFREYQLAPTWGGMGGTKAETDCFWYDHARVGGAP